MFPCGPVRIIEKVLDLNTIYAFIINLVKRRRRVDMNTNVMVEEIPAVDGGVYLLTKNINFFFSFLNGC